MKEKFTVGVEEEFFVVDKNTLDVVNDLPNDFQREAKDELGERIGREFRKCQIELRTRAHEKVSDVVQELRTLRSTAAQIAEKNGLHLVAASTHPFAKWENVDAAPQERASYLSKILGGVGWRLLVCGMHIHVEVQNEEWRVDVFNQLSYFLPHLLALSTSSPFWRGEDMQMDSFRTVVMQNLPRSGIPPRFENWNAYNQYVELLKRLRVVPDKSKIWWDLRFSKHGTLEVRVCDMCTSLNDARSWTHNSLIHSLIAASMMAAR